MLKDYFAYDSETLRDVVALIQANRSRCAIIVNSANQVVGVFSEGDVLRALMNDQEIHAPIRNLITSRFVYLRQRDMDAAFQLMRVMGVTLIPIVREDFTLTEVITHWDILEHVHEQLRRLLVGRAGGEGAAGVGKG